MLERRNSWLFVSGVLMLMGALLHLAIPLGGSEWYAFFGAPQGLVAMANAGSMRPAISCVIVAAGLAAAAAYAFAGAGVIGRLPFLRFVLGLVGTGLVIRGVGFVPLIIFRPHVLSGVCGRCEQVNAFVVSSSIFCLLVGFGYIAGAVRTGA